MATLLNNVTTNRYNLSNFLKFTEENGFNDFDFFYNRSLTRSIKEIPTEGIKNVLEGGEVRLDKISYDLYDTTALWWLLAIYNDIPNIFCNTVTQIKYPSLTSIEDWYFTNREKLVYRND